MLLTSRQSNYSINHVYRNADKFEGFRTKDIDEFEGFIKRDTNEFQGFRKRSLNDCSHVDSGSQIHENSGYSGDQDIYEVYGISQQKPKHPEFAIQAVRYSSYRNFPVGVKQTPEDLAAAGLFYSGREDVVYCFHCGQGLKSWEPEDNPWIEHARWSPKCRFIHDVHGKEFVQIVQNSASNSKEMIELKQRLNSSKTKSNGNVSGLKKSCKIPENLVETFAARSLLTGGYSRDIVWKLIKIFVRINGTDSFSSKDLMQTLFDLEDGKIEDFTDEDSDEQSRYEDVYETQTIDITPEPNLPVNESPKSTDIDITERSVNTSENKSDDIDTDGEVEALTKENENLRKITMCKVCMEETVSILFLPCGHLACCGHCAPAVRTCPLCRTFIKGTVKTFLS